MNRKQFSCNPKPLWSWFLSCMAFLKLPPSFISFDKLLQEKPLPNANMLPSLWLGNSWQSHKFQSCSNSATNPKSSQSSISHCFSCFNVSSFKFQTISSHCRLDIERKNSQINIVQGKVWHVNKLDSMMEHLIRPVQSIPFHWLCLCPCSLYVKSRLQPTAVTTSYKSLQSNVF